MPSPVDKTQSSFFNSLLKNLKIKFICSAIDLLISRSDYYSHRNKSFQEDLQHAEDTVEVSVQEESKTIAGMRERRSDSRTTSTVSASENLCDLVCKRTKHRCDVRCNRSPSPLLAGCRALCASQSIDKCIPSCLRWVNVAGGQ